MHMDVLRLISADRLCRSPAPVFAMVDEGPVTITRQDGDPMVLTSESQYQADQHGRELVARLITALLSPDRDNSLVQRLRVVFPWMSSLSVADQEEFAREIVETAVTGEGEGTSNVNQLILILTAWEDSAEILASHSRR